MSTIKLISHIIFKCPPFYTAEPVIMPGKLLLDALKCYFSFVLNFWYYCFVTRYLTMLDWPCQAVDHAPSGSSSNRLPS